MIFVYQAYLQQIMLLTFPLSTQEIHIPIKQKNME